MSSARPLKVGVHLPTVEEWWGGRTARWKEIVALATRAEEVGFDSLWLPDHLLYEWSAEPPARGVWEAWTLLAAPAASPKRIEPGPFVACTGFRNPALLATMADTLDEASAARPVLRVGAGVHRHTH